ncbi:MAG: helix-turn-helix domain-containing protein [Pseudonocardiaceae bacterium]|nr:helix-turn-helix domain-containing protein [Pseudonocardiaceae bacterium]
MTPLPLDQYEVFRSHDLAHTRETVGRIFCPHRMDLVGRDTQLDTRIHARRLKNVGVCYVAYGGEVRVDPGETESFYVVNVPTTGKGLYQCGSQHVQTALGSASVATATEPLSMRLSADTGLLAVRVERPALEAKLSEMLGQPLQWPIRFTLGMDVSTGYGRSWHELLLFMTSELNRPDSMLSYPLAMQQAEENLILGLLASQPSNYSKMLEGERLPAPNRSVNIAIDLMEGHPEWFHTVGTLAREAGVSSRALQKAFSRYLGTSPSVYLRSVRLQRVRDQLRATQPDMATVSEVAGRWGFIHHGRFAAWYRQRFGESPKQTLRKSAGVGSRSG